MNVCSIISAWREERIERGREERLSVGPPRRGLLAAGQQRAFERSRKVKVISLSRIEREKKNCNFKLVTTTCL